MKRILLLTITIFFISESYCQTKDTQIRGYGDEDFTSVGEIMDFFNKNIKYLDQIEGVYDYDGVAITNSPWEKKLYYHGTMFVVQSICENEYEVYSSYGSSFIKGKLSFTKIGDTNVYRAYWNESSIQG